LDEVFRPSPGNKKGGAWGCGETHTEKKVLKNRAWRAAPRETCTNLATGRQKEPRLFQKKGENKINKTDGGTLTSKKKRLRSVLGGAGKNKGRERATQKDADEKNRSQKERKKKSPSRGEERGGKG